MSVQIPVVITPPIASWLITLTGTFAAAFMFSGSLIAFSAICLVLLMQRVNAGTLSEATEAKAPQVI
eukprot:m.189495 g.189495  ORF g.189495 m.189495 type:complete len:67 (-) comp53608_c0_seq4:123-323(-)